MSQIDAKRYLQSYREENPQYSHYSDEALYRKLRYRENDSALPTWEDVETKNEGYGGFDKVTSRENDISPSRVNGLASWLDGPINENSYGWAKAAYNNSLTGLLEQSLTGQARYDLTDYNPGIIENILAGALSFIMPLDLLTMGVGGKVAKGIMGAPIFGRLTQKGAQKTAHELLKKNVLKGKLAEEAVEISEKYLLKNVPWFQGGITGATQLGMYESALEGLNASIEGEDILPAMVHGLATGITWGGLSGMVGGGMMGKGLQFEREAIKKAATKGQTKSTKL